MRNILLVFEQGIELDFVRVVLSTLGFNTYSLHKNMDKVKKFAPDLVIVSSLNSKEDVVNDLSMNRIQKGKPKFLWLGTQKKLQKMTDVDLKMVDDTLTTPIQPEKLIEAVCRLLNVSAKDYIKKYHDIQIKSSHTDNQEVIFVLDKEKKKRYAEAITRVESMDRVLHTKDIMKNQPEPSPHNPDLLAEKKKFVKALFGKK